MKNRPVMNGIWITDKAKEWIENWLKPEFNGFEYGSGCSTRWLGEKVISLTSVEHREKWFNRTTKLLADNSIKNVKLIYEPDREKYPTQIETHQNESLDFVFVDGQKRSECAILSWPKIKEGGVLILDNSDYKNCQEAVKFLDTHASKRLYFKGPGLDPWSGRQDIWETSIWIKGEDGIK